MAKNPQIEMLKNQKLSYGGDLRNTRKGRIGSRPLDTRYSMHNVLRSTKATGQWSFNYRDNPKKIREIVRRFANKYGIQIISISNVGNHLHMQLKLANRYTWKPFIRAITAAIAMAITGQNRWNKVTDAKKFWDYRPFTRVVIGRRAFLALKDYIEINKWEGYGYDRGTARAIVAVNKVGEAYWNTA